MSLITNLALKYDSQPENEATDEYIDTNHSLMDSLYLHWSNHSNHNWGATLAENTMKTLQTQTQFSLYILQNLIEFDVINQQQQQPTSMDSSAIIKNLNDYSLNKKQQQFDLSFHFFSSLVDLIKKQTKLFYDFIKSQWNSVNASTESMVDQTSYNSNIDHPDGSNANTNGSSESATTPKSMAKLNENKQAIQLYCNLIEQLSILFTRIKSHQLLDKLLIQFASSIELITELNYISKQIPQQQLQTSGGDSVNLASPGNPSAKKSASHNMHPNTGTILDF